MTTQEVADTLVKLCSNGQFEEAMKTLYSPDIVSHEVNEPMKVTRGIEAVKGKGNWWYENHEVHSGVTRGPWINGDTFVVEHSYDITFKPTGARNLMNETAIYRVEGGKIVEEHFLSPA